MRNPTVLPCFMYGTARACIRKRFKSLVFASIDALSRAHSVSETCVTLTPQPVLPSGTLEDLLMFDALRCGNNGMVISEQFCTMGSAFLNNAASILLLMIMAAAWASTYAPIVRHAIKAAAGIVLFFCIVWFTRLSGTSSGTRDFIVELVQRIPTGTTRF